MAREWNYSYWQTKTWDECVHQIFQSHDFYDIIFVAEADGESVSFPAHKLVLSMSSPMFAEKFSYPRLGTTNSITLHNFQPKMVEIMLTHIYYRKEVHFESLHQCFGVLKLATEYELSSLKRMCTGYIEQFIDENHVCAVYEAAVSVRNRNLALKCSQFIQMNTRTILEAYSWKDALPVTVKAIVKQEYLNINEEQLFEAIVYWAKCRPGASGSQANPEILRQEVEPFLPHIRFLNMTVEAFLKITARTSIFSSDEALRIAVNMVDRDSRELPSWFNRNTNHRSYEHRATADNAFHNDWFNTNQAVHSHSDHVEKVCCSFKAGSSEFTIHELHIAICDDCFALNSRSKKENIILKVTVEVDTAVQETTIQLHITRNVIEKPAPNFDKKEPLLLARFQSTPFISPVSVGMGTHAPIIENFLDPSSPKTICTHGFHQDKSPSSAANTLGELSNFALDQPLLVQSEQRFKVSIETENKERFFCCRKRPSFQGAPFTGYAAPGWKADETTGVWCALEKIRYSVSRGEGNLYD